MAAWTRTRENAFFALVISNMMILTFSSAPVCDNPSNDPNSDSINEAMLKSMKVAEPAIHNEIKSTLQAYSGDGNLLEAPYTVDKSQSYSPCSFCPSVKYGYKGTVQTVTIKNNDVQVEILDANVCQVEFQLNGYEAEVTGEVSIKINTVHMAGKLEVFAVGSATIGMWGDANIGTIIASFKATTYTNYNSMKNQCRLSNVRDISLQIPTPQLSSVDHDTGSSVANSIMDFVGLKSLINSYLKNQVQSEFNEQWTKSGGMGDIIKNTVVDEIKKNENGVETGCPACVPGQSGNPILGCSEINACVDNPCETKNMICVDKKSPALNNIEGRTCTQCSSGSRPKANQCVACDKGTAGIDGFCNTCNPNLGKYSDEPGLTSCKNAPTCIAGETVTFPGSPVAPRQCGLIILLQKMFTDGNNQVARLWRDCAAGTYISVAGTTTNNVECEPCEDGFYQPTTNQPNCLPVRNCQPGYRITKNATLESDRECGACPDGWFSNTTNAVTCTKHRQCADGEYLSNKGTKTSDQICGDIGDCVPGQFVIAPPDPVTPRKCGNCTQGTFTDQVNAPFCRYHKNCTAGYAVLQQPSESVDRTCVLCANETYSAMTNSLNCTPWTRCKAGEFDVSPSGPSADSNRDCAPCALGEFSLGTDPSRRRRSLAHGPSHSSKLHRDVSKRQQRQLNGDTVWLCASDCNQQAQNLERALNTPCTPLVIGECTKVNFTGMAASMFFENDVEGTDGQFFWMPKVIGDEIQLTLYGDSSCSGGPNTPPTIPVKIDLTKHDDQMLKSYVNSQKLCSEQNTDNDCVHIKLGATIQEVMDKCSVINYYLEPQFLGVLLTQHQSISLNVKFEKTCVPLLGKPETCKAAVATTSAPQTISTTSGSRQCTASEFQCQQDFQCIAKTKVCDGRLDCSDDSDEADCDVTPPPTPYIATTTTVTTTTTTSYALNFNTESCRRWRSCNRGEYITINGSYINNRECASCVLGTSYSNMPNMFECLPVHNCEPGQFVAVDATLSSNRKCESAPAGTFTNISNQLTPTPWTRCAPGSRVVSVGSTTEDRECVSCSASTYQPKENQDECIAYQICEGGIEAAPGNTTTDRTCQPCGIGTFKPLGTASRVACTAWMNTCVAGEYVLVPPTTTNDRECGGCGIGFFSNTTNAPNCTGGSICQPGTYMSSLALGANDTSCYPCMNGFTNTTNQTKCTPFSICQSSSGDMTFPGNATHDSICTPKSSNPDNSAASKSTNSSAAMIGGVVGGLVVLAIVAVVLFMVMQRQKNSDSDVWKRENFENPLYDKPQPNTMENETYEPFSLNSQPIDTSFDVNPQYVGGDAQYEELSVETTQERPVYFDTDPPPSNNDGYMDVSFDGKEEEV